MYFKLLFLAVSLEPFKSVTKEKQFRIKYAHMFVQMASNLKNQSKKRNRTRQNKPEKQAEAADPVLKSFSSPSALSFPQKLTARTTEAE